MAISNLKNKEMLISKALTYSNISHYEFVLINSMLKEHDDIKEETKKFKDLNNSLQMLNNTEI